MIGHDVEGQFFTVDFGLDLSLFFQCITFILKKALINSLFCAPFHYYNIIATISHKCQKSHSLC